MELEFRRISLWPLFKISFLVSVVLFLLLLIFMGNLIFETMQQSMNELGIGGNALSNNLSFFTFLSLAISNAFFFSLLTTVAGVLYNVFAHWVGGIKVTVNDPYESYIDDYNVPENPTDETSLPNTSDLDTHKE